ncbi:hypothetical protein ACFWDQ_16705 [Streptomyces sp. NPDC060053]|uniref:hypothetical protein n=1 Tax=Streptomyces sp. NPDC060053 TaxID=3347047 RepID=UPI0036A99337
MITAATVRGNGRLDDITAGQVADLWNAAYPTMRTILTASIDGFRARIQREGWTQDALPKTDWGSDKDLGAKLARLEGLRRVLGQLDRGTHRGCTRSPGGFSLTSAYWSVRDVLTVTTINDRGLADVYQLASLLAYVQDAIARERLAANRAA